MNSESSLNGSCRVWHVFKVSLLATLISCGYAWGRIGETQQEMIRRLGEPKSKSDNFCHFSLGDFSLSAQFKNGICVEENYNITRIKAQKRERIRRIEFLLSEASGGKGWDVVNLSGGEVEWETKDGTLNAILHNQEERGGSREDPDSGTAEYLTVASVAFQLEAVEQIKKRSGEKKRNYPYPLIRILILGVLGCWAFVCWREKRRKISIILWILIFAANPLVPLPKVPIVLGYFLLACCAGIVLFFVLGLIGRLLAKLKLLR